MGRFFLRASIILILILMNSGCSNTQQIHPDQSQLSSDTSGNCREEEYGGYLERIGVLRSTDRGVSWTFLGDACFHTPNLDPVDPSPLAYENGIVLYFLDILTLNRTDSDSLIYRSFSTDGLNFSGPTPAFGYPDNMTDPYILRLPDNSFRLYAGLPISGTIMAAYSQDGMKFDTEMNLPEIPGGTPGALLLPTGEIRLFSSGPEGIKSIVSPNGIDFTDEPGVRIPKRGIRVTDPHPIQLREGGYLMVFVVHPEGEYETERERLASMEMYLATSTDAYNWEVAQTPIGYGSVPGLVETEDGTLYIYFVDVTYSWDYGK